MTADLGLLTGGCVLFIGFGQNLFDINIYYSLFCGDVSIRIDESIQIVETRVVYYNASNEQQLVRNI